MIKPSAILLGAKPASVLALSIMLDKGWDVKYVVASDSDNDWINGPKLAEYASSKGIEVVKQNELPVDTQVDFVISYMHRFLVKEGVLSMAKKAALNFHAAPLPEYGGWAFYNMAILEQADEYGCTCHYMDNNFDTGPLLKVRKFKINHKLETAFSLEQKAQAEMICLFYDFCKLAEKNTALPIQHQEKSKMRYLSGKEFQVLKQIPKNADKETIDRYARAFWYPPYQCAFLTVNGEKAEIVPQIAKEHIATLLHHNDYENLTAFLKNYEQRNK